ncbi:MAG: hypothetical protein ACJ8OJ_05850, partial [Povalibacter sp.]
MDSEYVQRIATEWIEIRGAYGDAWEELWRLSEEDPKTGFRIIEEIHHRISDAEPIDYELMGILAAGPLEDLLAA